MGHFGVFGGLGISWAALNYTIGELKPAFPGDPGAIIKGTVYPPGSKLDVSGISSNPGFGFSVGVKMQILDWLYIEAGYSQSTSVTIDKYSYTLSDTNDKNDLTVYPGNSPSSITVPDYYIFTIGVGIGLL